MTDGRSWQGNWRARLYKRARERGYDSLTAFAAARPTASPIALAEELGKDDIAAVQVLGELLVEADQRKQVTRFMRDVLVRMLSQNLPNGWPAEMDDQTRFAVAKAIAFWNSFVPETHKARAEQARASLRATPPPPGWRPLDPDDELLRTLLPDGEA